MRAITFDAPGDEDVLNLTDVDAPAPGPGEVLITVAAAGINNADLLQRRGKYPVPPGASEILGLECSGTIAALGEGVTGWSVGDEVCVLLTGGGYAEQVAVPAEQLLPIPAGISLEEAAALPEVACTVYSNIGMVAGLKPGQSLLVHGGGSGIGTHAIQWAHALGARVFTTAGSAQKLDAARQLGADVAINYRDEDFAERIAEETSGSGVDVILDIIGAPYLEPNLKSLANNGHLVIIGTMGGMRTELNLGLMLSKRASVTATTLRARPLHEKAEIVAAVRENVWPLIESGQIKPMVDTVLPLDQAAEAHRILAEGRAVGKVLLKP
ncbi:NAD(P)H-quinone oxidoreductase [Nesterenkonia massiliensis]|uniref:NAD(P)H-quinone oxidoreductase n=1 Tax=Nesterenkonia massiliensis TaxID=1232429 RepID=A0ABT2HR13_9MICC|nr:NAD(P)H-quinone oxidoreductase [Nesterenkonia massiliensis]MCT1607112.1 NAD(P)H-quinone oxidoreductase [Nesterenkonia massiliensis]